MAKKWFGRLFAAVFGVFVPTYAHATLTVTPIAWNVVGLDSNSPTSGPKDFPVGARVCSNVATTNVAVNWNWDSANANISLRPGSLSTITLASIGAGACSDAYFEVEVNQVAAAYDTVRRYHVTATDGSGTASTPTPRELYVEHLISQNRNSITGIKLNGMSIPAGGSMSLVVGNTYTIELDGGTATQGYNQFEDFINFPNTIFQVLAVSSSYSADNSPYVANPSDKLYADACLWESDPTSPNYRSCVGGDYKAGGSTVVTTYTIKVISGGGTAQTLNSLLYDFSGSSYHYNADFGVNAVIANIIDPTALTISKAFSPTPTVAGGTSTLTFTISNPNPSALSGANFADTLPLLSGGQMVVATPATYSTSGCGSPTFAPGAGASSISFGNGSVAANSSCVVSVLVSVPSSPTSGTYSNTSNDLFVGSTDTGHSATANLALTSSSAGSGVCGLTLANWTVPNGTTANPPDLTGGVPSVKAANVSTATAAANVPASTAVIATSGENDTTSWETFGYKSGGQYIQFVVDTSKYTKVQMSFWVADPSPANGPNSVVLAYSTGGSFTTATTFDPSGVGTGFVQHTFDFTGLTNTSGNTTFRLTPTGAKNDNSGASLNYDNISFTGCSTPTQPTLTKSFSPNPIAVNGTSTLTFTLTNSNSVQLTGAKFTDSLPAGLQVAATPSASTTCTGSPTWAPSAGATSLAFGQATGANIPANGSCTASVNVKVTTAGPHTNVSGFISTTEGGTNSGAGGSATASIDAILPPVIAKSFDPNPILVNGTSLLTFTISNPNASDMLTGIAFIDTYPSGLVNASPLPPVTNSCGGGVSASAGGNSFATTGGSLAGGASCTLSVTVTSATAGVYANTSGAVIATTAGTGNTASASLTVNAPHPAIGVKKQVGTSATGPWFDFVSVAPGTSVYYQFTAENTGDVTLNPFSVSDPTLAGTAGDPAACTWQTTNSPSTLPALPVASATIDPTATCVVGPISAANGDHPNTATAHGTYSGTVYTSTASADYIGATPGFSLLKQISTSASGPWSSAISVSGGDNVYYKFTLVNTGALALSSISVTDALVNTASCTFTDPLPVGGATTCIVGPVVASGSSGSTTANIATGNGSNGGTTYHTAPSTASYSIGAASADLAITKNDGTTTVVAGGSTTYTITVTNNGPSEVTDATVVDTAPAGMTFGSWTCAVTNTGSGGGSVTTACGAASGSGNLNTTVTMKPGAVITYTVPATIASSATGSLSNTATVAVPATVTDPTPGNNSATDTDTISLVADLSITKTDGATSAIPGSSTTYTIVVTNNGPSDVTGAKVSDVLPAAVTGASFTAIQSGGASGFTASGSGNVNDTVNMPAGSTITYTLHANISSSATGSLSNTATVTAPVGVNDPDLTNNSATDTDTLTPQADLAISKTDGVTSVTAGSSTTYTIVVSNNGPSDVTGATVSDILPAAITSDTFTAVQSGGASGFTASGSGNINDTVNMPAGSTITYTLHANISSSATGSLSNTATVTAPAGVTDTNPSNNSATDTDSITPLTPTADLSITKTDGVASVNAGGTTSYTIVVSNAGPSAADGAVFTDPAVANLSVTSVSCGSASGGAACPAPANTTIALMQGSGIVIPTLPSGGSVTFTVNASIAGSATGTISNTASIAAPAGVTDPIPGNNSSTDTDTVNLVADLSITKSDGMASATPGGSTTYTIVVTNHGPSAVTGATVTDNLPAAITSDTFTAVQSGGASGFTASGSGNINDTVNMPAASTITYTLHANISSSATGSLSNTATVTAPGGVTDPDLTNNSATDTDTLTPQVTLNVVKTDGSTSYTPGGTATYTVTITDTGASNAANLTVSDALPSGVTLTAAVNCTANGNATCGTVTGSIGGTSFGTTSATVGSGIGDSLVFTAPVAFASSMTTDPLVNTATATDLATSATASASDSDALAPQVTLAVTKTDGSTTYTPGGTATYTVTVTHGGLSDATNITVSDPLPAGVALTGTVTCIANGTASCGTVTGTVGQTSFSTTGASIAAGSGNSLVFSAPVAFDAAMTSDPLVNTATATDLLSGANGSGSDSDARSPQVSLSVTKTDGSPTYTPGGTATYTVTVVDTGLTDALNVSVSDSLLTGVTLTGTVTCTANGSSTCGTVTGASGQTSFSATGATITAGGGNSLVFTVPVAFASNLADDPLVNSATAKDLASGASGSGSDSDTRAAQAALSVTKTDGSPAYTPGATATYTIVVTNAGPSDAMSTTVSDPLPAGVTLTGNATCVAAGTASCGTVSGTTGQTSFGATGASIAAGGGNSLTFTAPVAFASNLTTDPLVNTVAVTDPASASPVTASDSDTLADHVDLAITKTDGVTNVTAGGTTTYTIVVTNGGPSDAVGAMVTDTLPAAITGASWTCAASGGGSCTASGSGNISDTVNVPVGATLTYTLVAAISASATGTLMNTTTVAPPGGVTDVNLANNSATDSDTISGGGGSPSADLSISKTDGVASVNAGATTSYTIVVSNGGPSSADGAVFTDPAVANLNVTSVSCGSATGGAVCPTVPNTTVALMQGTGTIIPTLPFGGSVTFTVNATVASSATGTIANTAHIAAPAGVTDPKSANNSATDSDTVTLLANLTIAKTSANSTYAPGGNGTYSITVTNSGPSDASSVTVSDNLPAGLTLIATVTCSATGSATCGTITGSAGATSFTAANATIAAGGGNRLVYTVAVNYAASLKASQITNTASANAPMAASVATASHTNTLATSGGGGGGVPPTQIPVDDPLALVLLAGLMLLFGARGLRARR